ncbi:MAG: hypothetical protein ACYDCH_05660 [Gaiellaceae bacterium]
MPRMHAIVARELRKRYEDNPRTGALIETNGDCGAEDEPVTAGIDVLARARENGR